MAVFRFAKRDLSEEILNEKNVQLLQIINDTGKVYLTHTKVHGKYGIRLVVGQTRIQQKHVKKVWEIVLESLEKIKND